MYHHQLLRLYHRWLHHSLPQLQLHYLPAFLPLFLPHIQLIINMNYFYIICNVHPPQPLHLMLLLIDDVKLERFSPINSYTDWKKGKNLSASPVNCIYFRYFFALFFLYQPLKQVNHINRGDEHMHNAIKLHYICYVYQRQCSWIYISIHCRDLLSDSLINFR